MGMPTLQCYVLLKCFTKLLNPMIVIYFCFLLLVSVGNDNYNNPSLCQ